MNRRPGRRAGPPKSRQEGRMASLEQGSADDLLERARARLREQEEAEDVNSELGYEIALGAGDVFRGRWRSDALPMQTKKRGLISVYGLWDEQGNPCFFFQHTRLVWEVEEQKPQVGDEVVIVRGEDADWETRDGELRTTYRYAMAVQRSDAPLPGSEKLAPAEPVDEPDDEFGF